jgi:hypothetical protein
MTQKLQAVLRSFAERLDQIDQETSSVFDRPYRAEGSHVTVGSYEPLSDEYFRSHGLAGSAAPGVHEAR